MYVCIYYYQEQDLYWSTLLKKVCTCTSEITSSCFGNSAVEMSDLSGITSWEVKERSMSILSGGGDEGEGVSILGETVIVSSFLACSSLAVSESDCCNILS